MEDASTSFWARNQFLIRRLHSLSGLIPVGAFMCIHLATNASILGGNQAFQDNVDRIHSLGPILPLVEWVFIFLPLIFHAVIGFVIIGGALPNTTDYPYPRNIRYTLQRVTGIIAFVYIFYHVLHMHWLGEPLEKVSPEYFGRFEPHDAAETAAAALQDSLLMQLFYAVGVLSCVYHLANGLWTMGITWGVWTSKQAQRRADYVCTAFGVLLAIVGMAALFGFLNVTHAPIVNLTGEGLHDRDATVSVAGTTPTALAQPEATLTDLDSPTIAGLEVRIENPWDGPRETLTADATDTSIEVSYEPPVLRLSGVDSTENYQKVLRTITYQNTAEKPNPAPRKVEFIANDGERSSVPTIATVEVRPVGEAAASTPAAE